jgi:translation initiation factor IF-3
MKNDSLKEQYRINERIRVREVRLVGDNVEQGVYPTSQALKMAEDQGSIWLKFHRMLRPPFVELLIIRNSFISRRSARRNRRRNL